MGGMDYAARQREFLDRLWKLQDEAGFSDAELARRIGVHQAAITRMKRDGLQTAGAKFLIGAGTAFPELGFTLFPELQILTSDCRISRDDEVPA